METSVRPADPLSQHPWAKDDNDCCCWPRMITSQCPCYPTFATSTTQDWYRPCFQHGSAERPSVFLVPGCVNAKRLRRRAPRVSVPTQPRKAFLRDASTQRERDGDGDGDKHGSLSRHQWPRIIKSVPPSSSRAFFHS